MFRIARCLLSELNVQCGSMGFGIGTASGSGPKELLRRGLREMSQQAIATLRSPGLLPAQSGEKREALAFLQHAVDQLEGHAAAMKLQVPVLAESLSFLRHLMGIYVRTEVEDRDMDPEALAAVLFHPGSGGSGAPSISAAEARGWDVEYDADADADGVDVLAAQALHCVATVAGASRKSLQAALRPQLSPLCGLLLVYC